MSQEAIDFVVAHSDSKGTYRAIMLAMAIRCRKKKQPFTVSVSSRALAIDVNVSPKWALDAVHILCYRNELVKIREGSGQSPSLYEIQGHLVQGTARRYSQIRWFARQRKKATPPLGIPRPSGI